MVKGNERPKRLRRLSNSSHASITVENDLLYSNLEATVMLTSTKCFMRCCVIQGQKKVLNVKFAPGGTLAKVISPVICRKLTLKPELC